ncbi:zinc finger protein 37 homolog [Patiria miniata]|uniref:C2H2-type domain-containing protein n=1 Tax=Patiria miniata TaxID=46514 RepID=A0A913ZNJ9_PATMI|nr:zinc finger protein 37 homolog [Patiria miniata]XP_038052691.1 zinc finger protein 37 homolog [Patiria miniata]
MDPSLLDEMDFSFSCDKCSFSTKDMMQIKIHMYEHRSLGKDPGQTVAAAGSDAPEATKEQVDPIISRDPGDDGHHAQDETPPSNKDVPNLASLSKTNTPNLVSSLPSTEERHSGGSDAPSVSGLRDEVSEQMLAEKDNSCKNVDEGVERTEGSKQCIVREATVIVARKEKAPGEDSARHQPQPQGEGEFSAQGKTGPDSIADRIQSRRRPSTKMPHEELEEKDDDYVPYQPAMSRFKRHAKRVKRRHNRSNLRVKAKLRPAVPSDRYKCQHCHFVCKFKQSLRAHTRGSHPEVYAEMIQAEKKEKEGAEEDVEEEYRILEDYNQEPSDVTEEIQSNEATDRYQCTLCETFFCRFKKDLHNHKSRVHGLPAPVYKYQSRIPDNRYRCTECDYICKFQRTLRLHCRSVHPKAVKSPEIKEKKEKKEKREKKVLESRYRCPECDFTCKFKGQLKKHKSQAHKKERPPKTMREQQCQFCSKFIQGTMHHYRRHLMTHTGEKPFKCDICDAVFGDQSRLNAHAPIHLEARNYLCDQCGKSFKRAINLRMHRKVHLVVRPHGCELCSYRCKRHDTLNLHMKRKHLKIRRVLCDTCGKKFFSEKECQLHAARKHLPRPTPFQCTFCPQAFPFAYNLRAHMKKHPEHKPFRCEFCSFESRSKASLQDHEKMHTGEKQKKCEMCDYTTSTSSNLYKHRKRQHGVVVHRNKSPRVLSPSQDRPSILLQPAILQNSPQASVPATPLCSTSATPQPHPMLPTPEILHAHHMHIQRHLQGALSPIPGQIQGSPSPALAQSVTQSVTVPTSSGHVDLRNVQAYEEIDLKDRRAIIYGREKSLIGSVITEALAEARNVVQSELYGSGHVIQSTVAPPQAHHQPGLPVTTTMAPPNGGVVSTEGIIHGAIQTSTGISPSGASGIFNSIMNIHY